MITCKEQIIFVSVSEYALIIAFNKIKLLHYNILSIGKTKSNQKKFIH